MGSGSWTIGGDPSGVDRSSFDGFIRECVCARVLTLVLADWDLAGIGRAVTPPDHDGACLRLDGIAVRSLRAPSRDPPRPITFALLGFLLAAVSSLVAGGIAWGAFRAQLERQRDEIRDLRGEVRALARPSTTLHPPRRSRRPARARAPVAAPDLIRWLSADWTHAVTARVIALGLRPRVGRDPRVAERVVGRPMPRTRLVLVLDPRRPRGQRARRRQPAAQEHRARPAVSPGAAAPRPPAARLGAPARLDAPPSPPSCSPRPGGRPGARGVPAGAEAVLDTQSPAWPAPPTPSAATTAPPRCSRAGRWWPAMPPQDDGTRRRCADVCEVSAGIAHCASSQVVTP